MKKLFLVSFLLIFTITNAYAAATSFFEIADPKNADLGGNVKVPVYNSSGAALDVGDVVVWDVGTSTGDDDLYVTTTTTANTGLVAGVVSQAIATASSGNIIVYGLAECDIDSAPLGPVVAGTLLCTSGVAGGGEPCLDNSQAYAVSSATTAASGQGKCFVIGQ